MGMVGLYTSIDRCQSIVRTSAGIANSGKCLFWGAAVENYDADFVITLDDSTDGTGTAFLVLGGAAERGGSEIFLTVPLLCETGIYVAFTTSGNNVTVFYTPLA